MILLAYRLLLTCFIRCTGACVAMLHKDCLDMHGITPQGFSFIVATDVAYSGCLCTVPYSSPTRSDGQLVRRLATAQRARYS